MIKKILVLSILMGSLIAAQSFKPQISSLSSVNKIDAVSEIKILAVMVEFQPDEYDLTVGDGTFGSVYTQDYGNDIIDPLPHDVFYFQDHLEFVKNYYTNVSNGNVDVSYSILPTVLTVSKVMREYSPVGDESYQKLADFSQEVWELAADQYSTFNFGDFNTFIIFHAGVGKDISTTELLGESRDLPSLYLGLETLREFYGESFEGFQVSDGSFVTNSIIMPETESREESGFGETYLTEISINGFIVSNIASHLGLPDLYDSETGLSAIGRFGLMDGQSLFAYLGLFPPEPSAWEKIYLGWEEPLVIDSPQQGIEAVARFASDENDNRIIKIPINATEYYLIENRQRDANNDGCTVTYKVNGQVRTINFDKDYDSFANYSIDTLSGVVTNIDEFDWALPGSGILIWHIDEKIISENLADNRINVGENRGVDLEEADGIQDIGEIFTTIFGEEVVAEGDEYDFWFSSNDSELFENEFGANTKPSTKTNSGGNSLITISNFSDISNRMTFDLELGNSQVELISDNFTYENLSNYFTSSDNEIIYYALNNTNELTSFNATTEVSNSLADFSNSNLSVIENYVIGALDNSVNIAQSVNDELNLFTYNTQSNVSSQIISSMQNGEINILVGLESGYLLSINFSTTSETFSSQDSIKLVDDSIQQITTLDDEILVAGLREISNSISSDSFVSDLQIKKLVTTKDKNGQTIVIVLHENNLFQVFNTSMTINEFEINSSSEINDFSIGDLKNDGENYIIVNAGNQILAYNIEGNLAENFPIKFENDLQRLPLVADINNDGQNDIISIVENGNIYAYSGNSAELIDGFPISMGGYSDGQLTITKRDADLLLTSVTTEGQFYTWTIESTGEVSWGSKYANSQNISSLGSASSTNLSTEYFPKNKTYNWPNPVYENVTYIRTFVSEDSKVKITIFDLAGDLVDKLSYNAIGGIDNEIAWNVSNIQSGAYFAHVNVDSGNNSDSKIIKIAVIK